jgi:hypothetical protein
MKKIICLLACCLFLQVGLMAQTKDEQQVASAVEKLKQVLIDPNKQQLENLTAKELSYGHSSGKVEDQAAFVEALVSGKSDFASINLSNQTIQVTDQTAVVRHQFEGELVAEGKTSPVKLGVLLVWQKQKGTWKLLARQAFKL